MGCHNSTVVSAPPAAVWQAIRNFHDMSAFGALIERVDRVGEVGGDAVGAKRVVNGAFHETLVALDDDDHSLSYSIDDGPGPVAKDAVAGYLGTVRLLPVTDTDETLVEWTSQWRDAGGGVQEFCDPIYQGALAGLKAHFGA